MTNHNIPNETEFQSEEFYPEKPRIRNRKQSLLSSIINLAIFVLLFHFFILQDFFLDLAFLFVLLFHESGHYLLMKRFNYSNINIFFIPLFGAAISGEAQVRSNLKDAMVSLAGPVPGILFGALLFFAGRYLDHDRLVLLANIFLVINIFNLLPFLPLDGGRLLESFIKSKTDNLQMVMNIVSIIIFAVFAFYSQNLILLFIPLFITLQMTNQIRLQGLRKKLSENGIELEQDYQNLTNKEYWKIRDQLAVHMKAFKNFIQEGHYQYSPQEANVVRQIKNILKPKRIYDHNFLSIFVSVLIWMSCFAIAYYIGDIQVQEYIDKHPEVLK